MKKLILITLLTLLGAVAAQAQIGSNGCDPSLAQRVYSPYRFHHPVNKNNKAPLTGRCVQVRGKIKFIKPPGEDGDIHISVIPDSPGILRKNQTALVVEIVCAKDSQSIANGNARVRCNGYQIPYDLSYRRISRFKVGQRVQIVGLQVVDYGHLKTGWTEIHPVTKFDPLH